MKELYLVNPANQKTAVMALEQIFVTKNHRGEYFRMHGLTPYQKQFLESLGITDTCLNEYTKKINEQMKART